MAACCRSTYINYLSACFSHCCNSCLNDITCAIMLHTYISNSPVICDSSDYLPLLLLHNIVKAVEEWGGRPSRETWADCLRKSRFEYPPFPSHPPILQMPFWPILQMPFCVYLLLSFGHQVWSHFRMLHPCPALWAYFLLTGVCCSLDAFPVITRQQLLIETLICWSPIVRS